MLSKLSLLPAISLFNHLFHLLTERFHQKEKACFLYNGKWEGKINSQNLNPNLKFLWSLHVMKLLQAEEIVYLMDFCCLFREAHGQKIPLLSFEVMSATSVQKVWKEKPEDLFSSYIVVIIIGTFIREHSCWAMLEITFLRKCVEE